MSDEDLSNLDDLGEDDLLDLGLDDDTFDLDGDGGFFLGEATKALDAAFTEPVKSAKPQGDTFLSNLLADRAAEITTIREQPTNSSAEGALARKKSMATLDAVASSMRSMAHLSNRRYADGRRGSAESLAGAKASSTDLLDVTLAGKGPDALSSTQRDDERITDEEFTDLEAGRAKLKKLLQRFVKEYREGITQKEIIEVELPSAASTSDDGEDKPGKVISIVDGTSLASGEFEVFTLVGNAPRPRTIADIKQKLKDIYKAQESRVSKIKSLLQEGETGLSDPMFVRPPKEHSSSAAKASKSTNPPEMSPQDKARLAYPSSDDSSSLSLSLGDSDEEAEAEKEAEKSKRRRSREAHRSEIIKNMRVESIIGANNSPPSSPKLANTLAVRETLAVMGYNDPSAEPADASSDLRGFAFALLEQLVLIHEDVMVAIATSIDFTRASVAEQPGKKLPPLRRLGLSSSAADGFNSTIDNVLHQGWEVLVMCVNSAKELPDPEYRFPRALINVLNKFISDWRGSYQLSSLFALKFSIPLNNQIALEYCGEVLLHAEAYQLRTVETAVVCVAEEALDGTLADAVVWIAPILTMIQMLADSPTGVNEDMLVLALDVLTFAVLGGGNASRQFVVEGGIGVLGELLRAIDPSKVKPDVTKRILKLLNPTSLGVRPHSFLSPGEDDETHTPRNKKVESQPDPQSDTSTTRKLNEFAFPAAASISAFASGALTTDPIQLGESKMVISEDGNEVHQGDDDLELAEDDFKNIISAIEITLEKYDGLNADRNNEALKQAEQGKVDAQKHRQSEAQAKAQTNRKRRNSNVSLPDAPLSPSDDPASESSLPPLPPRAADNQVLDECTFIVYSLMMVAIDVAINEDVMQLLARHVIGSDLFWNNKETMRGVLGCIQTLLANHEAYELHIARAGPAAEADLGTDVSVVLATSTNVGISPFSAHTSIRRVKEASGPNTASYYRAIMDAPTLAVLSLAIRAHSDVDLAASIHVSAVFKALYHLASAEPARSLLVSGCPDQEEEIGYLPPPPARTQSMRRTVSISLPEGARAEAGSTLSRRPSLTRQQHANRASEIAIGSDNQVHIPPFNALIPCLLHALTRTPFIQQRRLCISLLNKMIKGAYRPACTQLLGSLPLGVIYHPPLHQGRRSRFSVVSNKSMEQRVTALEAAGQSPPPGQGLGGVSSGTVGTRADTPGSFLKYVAKLVGTAAPELVPPLLALIREVGRFLTHPSSADVYDHQLLQTILRSVLSIVHSHIQEVPVVAGGCMTLAHLCRIPHTQVTFSPSRFGHSFRAFTTSAKASGDTKADSGEMLENRSPSSSVMVPAPVSPRVNRLDVPTSTLVSALESEPLLDTAIGFITATFIQNTTAPAQSASLSRRQSMQRVTKAPDTQPESYQSIVGPSAIVRRTLGFLLAVLATDAESAQSIVDEGGLPIIQESAGLKSSTQKEQPPTPDRSGPRPSSHTETIGRRDSITFKGRVTHPARDEALAVLLTRDEREYCKRQYIRLMQEQPKPISQFAIPKQLEQPAMRDMPHLFQVQLLMDSTLAYGNLLEEERGARDGLTKASERILLAIAKSAALVAAQQVKERADLEAHSLELRKGIEGFAQDAFFDLMRYSQMSVHKKLRGYRSASSAAHSPNRQLSGAYSPLPDMPITVGGVYHSPSLDSAQVQTLLTAMTKMQEQQMSLQAELLSAAKQGALFAHQPSTPPLTMVSLGGVGPLPPRPLSASLRVARRFAPPNLSSNPVSTYSSQQRYLDSRPPSPISARPVAPPRPSTPRERIEAVANIIDRRRQQILTPRRPASSPPRTSHSGGLQRPRRAEMEDSFIRDDDGEDNWEGGATESSRAPPNANEIAANATIDELSALMLDSAEHADGPSPPMAISSSLQHLTTLDLSRNYLGDQGLGRLVELLSLHTQARPTLLPHLTRLSLRRNGITSMYLQALLFEGLGVPHGASSSDACSELWVSPRPLAAFTDAQRPRHRAALTEANNATSHSIVSTSTLRWSCDDRAVFEIVTNVADYLLSCAQAEVRRCSVSTSPKVLLINIPADHITLAGVRVNLHLSVLEELIRGCAEKQLGQDARVSLQPANRLLVEGASRKHSASAAEESPFFRMVTHLDLSDNIGITPRSNRDLLAYVRLNPLLALDEGQSPILLGGTSVFSSSQLIMKAAAEKRTRQAALVSAGVQEVFTECWNRLDAI